MVTAYADAGMKYLAFLPNAWNPKTVGGSRIDVGWDSPLPHLFYWQGPDGKSRLLVWANPHYTSTGRYFGIQTCRDRTPAARAIEAAAPKMAKQLALLESRYPYDVWLVSNYSDNETPSLRLAELAKAWNARWRWPELRTVGDLSEPFRKVESRFGDRIPTLRGDITGGWAQHPVSTPPLLAMKRAADRLLPVAEQLATLVRLADPDFVYPAIALRRAWDALISRTMSTATVSAPTRAVRSTIRGSRSAIGSSAGWPRPEPRAPGHLRRLPRGVPTEGPSVFVFNPTLQPHAGTVEVELPESCAKSSTARYADGTTAPAVAKDGKLRFRTSEIPSMGYAVFPLAEGDPGTTTTRSCTEPPSVENSF